MNPSFAPSRPVELEHAAPQLRPAALRGAISMLLLVAVLLAWRRFVGALAVPLGLTTLVAVGIGLAAGVRLVRMGCDVEESYRTGILPWIALSSAVFTAAAVSIPGTTLGGLALLWAPLALEEFLYLRRWSVPAAGVDATDRAGNATKTSVSADLPGGNALLRSDDVNLHVWHVQERAATDENIDRLAGWIDVSFEAGQRTQVAHLAFCPPFAEAPTLSLQIVSDHDAAAQHTQLLPFGARLEVKLRQDAAESMQVRVQFLAKAAVDLVLSHRES